MTDQRALISCKRAWDGLGEFLPEFERLGVEAVVPDVPGQFLDEAAMLDAIAGIDGVLAGDDEITRRVIEAGDRLKVISKWGVGVDAIDREAAAEHGVVVFNTPGVFADELGDYAMGFLLLLARRQHEVDREVRAGRWHQVRGVTLRGRTLGVVGLGSSGRAFAERAMASGMRVIGYDLEPPDPEWLATHGVESVALEELLAGADVVSLHVPATPDTVGMIDRRAIRTMRPGVWLINTARGSLVDEEALIEALRDGRVGAAAIDVYRAEPLPVDSPLAALPNVVLGSHNGSNTAEAVARVDRVAIHNLFVGLGKA